MDEFLEVARRIQYINGILTFCEYYTPSARHFIETRGVKVRRRCWEYDDGLYCEATAEAREFGAIIREELIGEDYAMFIRWWYDGLEWHPCYIHNYKNDRDYVVGYCQG